mmetsp:Transcript_80629/g.168097  ORF Transcript_80629/g.168097 Transcript_80629/m.168097 type:complete len:392 (-) Transcript_80629:27-1202(-)
MSYTTQNRYNEPRHIYCPPKGGKGTYIPGTWWPDFGPMSYDYSEQYKMHPTNTVFKNQMAIPLERKNLMKEEELARAEGRSRIPEPTKTIFRKDPIREALYASTFIPSFRTGGRHDHSKEGSSYQFASARIPPNIVREMEAYEEVMSKAGSGSPSSSALPGSGSLPNLVPPAQSCSRSQSQPTIMVPTSLVRMQRESNWHRPGEALPSAAALSLAPTSTFTAKTKQIETAAAAAQAMLLEHPPAAYSPAPAQQAVAAASSPAQQGKTAATPSPARSLMKPSFGSPTMLPAEAEVPSQRSPQGPPSNGSGASTPEEDAQLSMPRWVASKTVASRPPDAAGHAGSTRNKYRRTSSETGSPTQSLVDGHGSLTQARRVSRATQEVQWKEMLQRG